MTGDYLYASPQPAEPDEERLAMEAVMESVDPATWPGLTPAQRCALGRFAKPQPAEQKPTPDVDKLVGALAIALEALEDVMGNINPERGFVEELEEELSTAADTVRAALASCATSTRR